MTEPYLFVVAAFFGSIFPAVIGFILGRAPVRGRHDD
jgi:hypothetical protein